MNMQIMYGIMTLCAEILPAQYITSKECHLVLQKCESAQKCNQTHKMSRFRETRKSWSIDPDENFHREPYQIYTWICVHDLTYILTSYVEIRHSSATTLVASIQEMKFLLHRSHTKVSSWAKIYQMSESKQTKQNPELYTLCLVTDDFGKVLSTELSLRAVCC